MRILKELAADLEAMGKWEPLQLEDLPDLKSLVTKPRRERKGARQKKNKKKAASAKSFTQRDDAALSCLVLSNTHLGWANVPRWGERQHPHEPLAASYKKVGAKTCQKILLRLCATIFGQV
jgi:hypothetical protein